MGDMEGGACVCGWSGVGEGEGGVEKKTSFCPNTDTAPQCWAVTSLTLFPCDIGNNDIFSKFGDRYIHYFLYGKAGVTAELSSAHSFSIYVGAVIETRINEITNPHKRKKNGLLTEKKIG